MNGGEKSGRKAAEIKLWKKVFKLSPSPILFQKKACPQLKKRHTAGPEHKNGVKYLFHGLRNGGRHNCTVEQSGSLKVRSNDGYLNIAARPAYATGTLQH